MSDHVSFGRIITSMKITKKIKITTKNLGNQVNGVTIHNVLENKIRHLVKNLKYSSLYENAR